MAAARLFAAAACYDDEVVDLLSSGGSDDDDDPDDATRTTTTTVVGRLVDHRSPRYGAGPQQQQQQQQQHPPSSAPPSSKQTTNPKPPAATTTTPRATQQPHPAELLIDLCSSSEEEEEEPEMTQKSSMTVGSSARKQPPMTAARVVTNHKTPNHNNTKLLRQSSSSTRAAAAEDLNSEEEDDELRQAIAVSLQEAYFHKVENNTNNNNNTHQQQQGQGKAKPPPLTHAAYYLDKAKRASSLLRAKQNNKAPVVPEDDDDDDSDDDDDALLQFDSGMIRNNNNNNNPTRPFSSVDPSSSTAHPPSANQSVQHNNNNTSVASHHHHHPSNGKNRGGGGGRRQPSAAPPLDPNSSRSNKPARPWVPRGVMAPRRPRRTKDSNSDNNADDDDDDDLWNCDPGLRRMDRRNKTNEAMEKKHAASSLSAAVAGKNPLPSCVIVNPYSSHHRSSLASTSNNSSSSTRGMAPSRVMTTTTTTTRADPFPYPKLTENAKQYPDLRVHYLLAFWKYGRSALTRHSHDRAKLDLVAKRVTRLAVATNYPVRSLAEYVLQRGGGSGSAAAATSVHSHQQVRSDLEAELEQGGMSQIVIRPENVSAPNYTKSKYYSIAEACLVVLLEHVESLCGSNSNSNVEQSLSDKRSWLSLVDMIPAIDGKLRRECPGRLTRRDDPDWGAHHYEQSSTKSMEILQIHKLECVTGRNEEVGPFIKRHSYQKKLYYELLPEGYHAAVNIRSRPFPEPPGHVRSSKIRSLQDVDPRYRNICLGVDLREGGGACKTLHQMCLKIEDQKCPYFVGTLSIGDYVFFTKKNATDLRMDYLCPVLVERKSIQDVAGSIYDGRWTSQKKRMYQAQYVFGYDNCRMVYIIEGNVNKQMTNGGYIGARWYNVDEEKLNREIENLNAEGFEVMRTTSVENSMYQLTRFAQQVAKEISDGTLIPRYTYAQFKTEVSKIPPQTNFSYMAQDRVREKARLVVNNGDVEVVSEAGIRDTAPTTRRAMSGEKNGAASASQMNNSRLNTSTNSARNTSVSKKRKLSAEDDEDFYFGWTMEALKGECVRFGLSSSGKRDDLVNRLKGPRPPAVWRERKQKKQWVPARPDTGGTALLVALHLYEQTVGPDNPGMKKDDLYVKAESLNISKNPFSGGTTQTGPYHYDGWSSMGSCLNGDPSLVVKCKNRYKLTTSGPLAGVPVAKAMHEWCHELGICPCEDENYIG